MTNTGIYIDTTVKTTANGVDTQAINGGDHLIVASSGSLVALGVSSNALRVHANSDTSVDIYGQLYSASGVGMVVEAGSDSLRAYINGTVSGLGGISDLGSNDQIFIGAQGDIFAFASAVELFGNDLFSNAGHVFGAGAAADDDGVAFDIYGAGAHVVNSGYAEGSVYAVRLANNTANNFTIDNTGTMRGGVALFAGVTATGITINNDGTWTASNDFNLSNGSDAVSNSGFMRGNIVMNGGDDTFTNTGRVHGTVNMGSGFNTVVNSGSMGGLSCFGAADSLTNNGAILGNVVMNSGETVINNGTITGFITFTGGSNTLDSRHGEIAGNVFGGSGNDNFTGGRFDDNFNGGGGNDTLRGGAGDDTLNGSGGKDTLIGGIGDDQLTGGAAADTFTFNGGFGHDVITDFTATGGSADTILFRHDFGSFAAVQAHMTQVGTSVVITLDSGHAIVLEGVTTASLTAGDFSFE